MLRQRVRKSIWLSSDAAKRESSPVTALGFQSKAGTPPAVAILSLRESKSSAQFSKMKDIPGLDALRALAITLVLVEHFVVSGPIPVIGSMSVMIFFVLSGFLIISLLHCSPDTLGHSRAISLRCGAG